MKSDNARNAFIGEKIREAREAAEKSQQELAGALGFESATAISLIESGERKVKAEDLEKIADFFARDIGFFFGKEGVAQDIHVALSSDEKLNKQDREAILHFIKLARQKHYRES